MKAEVYYFSGTGNSLVVARGIAEKLNGRLVPIASLMQKKKVAAEADVVGLVFPVYYATNDGGIPLMVSRFVEKLENLNSKYVFAVCTYGGMPGSTVENLKKAVETQGGKLACGFVVQLRNTKISAKKQQTQHQKMKEKVEAICGYVAARKEGKFETRGPLRKVLLAPLRWFEKPIFLYRYRKLSGGSGLSFLALVPSADKSFRVNEKCSGCGICARVCPAENIQMVEGKPVWQHRCETCYACYAWCPNQAVYGDIVAYNDHYRHPKVHLSEMLQREEHMKNMPELEGKTNQKAL
jgi:flavodoxin/Pyruvate/2-oxoacid:ferredoxin oxidoreductase delta subunit